MNPQQAPGPAIAVMNLQEFFHDSLQRALDHQKLRVDAHTEHYVASLLTRFARAETFHAGDDGRRAPRPLALRLAEALAAQTAELQRERWRELGDVALFMAGFFAGSFSRKLVDVDYCIAMGGRAYDCVATRCRHSSREAAFSTLFSELAHKFQRLVDVLNEIAETSRPNPDPDVLRLYELWLKTGSERSRRLLEQRGIVPVNTQAHA